MLRLAVILGLVLAAPVTAADPIDFGRDVLPILSENCFHCHGPDEKARKADLRLDTKDGAATVIAAGKSSDSELVQRLTSTEKSKLMPPPKSNRKLTAKQIETLTRWVDGGAKWGTHWAFAPVRRPAGNGIDDFVRLKLQEAGLKPSPEASREALIRRVTLDLTGLPPTLDEIDAFLEDTSPKYYEKVVDRLLASPRYGERMGAALARRGPLRRGPGAHGSPVGRRSGTCLACTATGSSARSTPIMPFDRFVTLATGRGRPPPEAERGTSSSPTSCSTRQRTVWASSASAAAVLRRRHRPSSRPSTEELDDRRGRGQPGVPGADGQLLPAATTTSSTRSRRRITTRCPPTSTRRR